MPNIYREISAMTTEFSFHVLFIYPIAIYNRENSKTSIEAYPKDSPQKTQVTQKEQVAAE